ncbi:hypothetical protein Ade02nite_15800 [Paractinoplanes deccanensis]|uniref:Uncharacterized protein n=1 Tax=Paractinoplanes deccanensis TaxID=113561 RepID=A0ABQ3XYX4_9ACTN|nr:hypothetical protein [Actinoplanes deccanensis]GID72939.1 hypothetical protein Ade02nite_15800 [Actinoplanes deccanensis]
MAHVVESLPPARVGAHQLEHDGRPDAQARHVRQQGQAARRCGEVFQDQAGDALRGVQGRGQGRVRPDRVSDEDGSARRQRVEQTQQVVAQGRQRIVAGARARRVAAQVDGDGAMAEGGEPGRETLPRGGAASRAVHQDRGRAVRVAGLAEAQPDTVDLDGADRRPRESHP